MVDPVAPVSATSGAASSTEVEEEPSPTAIVSMSEEEEPTTSYKPSACVAFLDVNKIPVTAADFASILRNDGTLNDGTHKHDGAVGRMALIPLPSEDAKAKRFELLANALHPFHPVLRAHDAPICHPVLRPHDEPI